MHEYGDNKLAGVLGKFDISELDIDTSKSQLFLSPLFSDRVALQKADRERPCHAKLVKIETQGIPIHKSELMKSVKCDWSFERYIFF